MIYIISGTNRPGSRTRQVADNVFQFYKAQTADVEMIDLAELPLDELMRTPYGSEPPAKIKAAIQKIDTSAGLVMVVPEYNGSMPGALKFFIDHWSYPRSFEGRPVAFVGLGFRWGGLRPVEHLQQVFGYRNAWVFPERVFIQNIGDSLKDGKIVDTNVVNLLQKQATGFTKFCLT
jgi:NAD(P)H-dependent FMN reductase